MDKGATFSPCRSYRYTLWRRWNLFGDSGDAVFIGLNPSTADEREDDPTIRRCIGFAKSWGYDGMLMLNAFAFRATEPAVMLAAFDPVGPDNDLVLKLECAKAAIVVAAWGVHCPVVRGTEVCKLVARDIRCLGRTKAGRPKHPLYLKKDTALEDFWSQDAWERIEP